MWLGRRSLVRRHSSSHAQMTCPPSTPCRCARISTPGTSHAHIHTQCNADIITRNSLDATTKTAVQAHSIHDFCLSEYHHQSGSTPVAAIKSAIAHLPAPKSYLRGSNVGKVVVRLPVVDVSSVLDTDVPVPEPVIDEDPLAPPRMYL